MLVSILAIERGVWGVGGGGRDILVAGPLIVVRSSCLLDVCGGCLLLFTKMGVRGRRNGKGVAVFTRVWRQVHLAKPPSPYQHENSKTPTAASRHHGRSSQSAGHKAGVNELHPVSLNRPATAVIQPCTKALTLQNA